MLARGVRLQRQDETVARDPFDKWLGQRGFMLRAVLVVVSVRARFYSKRPRSRNGYDLNAAVPGLDLDR